MFTLANNELQGSIPLNLWKHSVSAETPDTRVVMYYLGEKTLTLDQFNAEMTTLPSTLIAVVGSVLSILSVHSEESQRRKGYARYLISAACLDAADEGVEKVVLDDMTDNFGHIYIRLGMKYIDPEYPEMEGDTKKVGNAWKRLRTECITCS